MIKTIVCGQGDSGTEGSDSSSEVEFGFFNKVSPEDVAAKEAEKAKEVAQKLKEKARMKESMRDMLGGKLRGRGSGTGSSAQGYRTNCDATGPF